MDESHNNEFIAVVMNQDPNKSVPSLRSFFGHGSQRETLQAENHGYLRANGDFQNWGYPQMEVVYNRKSYYIG